MNDVYLWCVTGMTALVALNTLWRLWVERDRLGREDLSDEDRAFAWRMVIFLIFPLFTFLDLRTTIVACEWLGGYMKTWSYGLLWFNVVPAGLPSEQLIPVMFAGAVVETVLAVCLMPALLFRPHPFMATVIGYTVAFVLGLNFIVDPLLSMVGLGGPRWQVVYASGTPQEKVWLFSILAAGALIYLGLMMSQRVRLLFSGLSRPQASDDLKIALYEWKACPDNASLSCRLGLLYHRAGLRRRATSQLKRLHKSHPGSIYFHFLESVLSYKQRSYKIARKSFLMTSEFPGVDGNLKASLLAASACAAFADSDTTGALNLCERALEFDDSCLVARMVKVDVFLRQGKKEQAGEEILLAMRRGLTLDLEKKVPLDVDKAFDTLVRLESSSSRPMVTSLDARARSNRS